VPISKMILKLVVAIEAHGTIIFGASKLSKAIVFSCVSIAITATSKGSAIAERMVTSEAYASNRILRWGQEWCLDEDRAEAAIRNIGLCQTSFDESQAWQNLYRVQLFIAAGRSAWSVNAHE
jgi:hypothetical protein